MKELSLLYEYWCFIKINSLLRKRYKLISSDFITINREGIFVSLKKGVTSTLVYENPKIKETFKVCYNSIKSSKASNLDSRTEGSKTITQKPTGIMEEFLDKIINESSYLTFERSLDALGRENYIKDEYFNDRTVLVGSLRNKEQLEINLNRRNEDIYKR